MSRYELSDAVGLFSEYTSIINNLWTVYVVATFAAAGFGISAAGMHTAVAMAVTVGFWAFTLGHLHLLRQALAVTRALGREIDAALSRDQDGADSQFRSSISVLAKAVNPLGSPTAIHLLIDVCVTIALWAQVPEVVKCVIKLVA